MHQVFKVLDVGKHAMRINNRKLLLGICASLGLNADESKAAITVLDKIAKTGRDAVLKDLIEKVKIDQSQAKRITDFAEVKIPAAEGGTFCLACK